jgi:hypothetical protein
MYKHLFIPMDTMHFAHLRFILLSCLAIFSTWASDLDTRISSLDSRMTAVKAETAQGTTGAKMASASPLIDGYGLFATADLLYWNLKEGGSDYALAPSGKVWNSHFDWNFGFRAGAGYHLEHDAWDWLLNFTWLHARADNHAHRAAGGLASQKGLPSLFAVTEINSHWHVHYYVLDLEVGRDFFITKYLAFRPQFGIESAWIPQRRHYSLKAGPDFGQKIYGKNHFWGIGPRAGLGGTWYFGHHFSLLSALSGSLQWGRFESRLKESLLEPGGKVSIVNVNGDLHRLVPNVQARLGLSWDADINDSSNHLGIALLYEFQYWWRQNQFLNEQPPAVTGFQHESGDLSLNGATLNVRFDF